MVGHWWESKLAAWGMDALGLAVGGFLTCLKPAVGTPILTFFGGFGVALLFQAWLRRDDTTTVETRPTHQGDWALLVVKNTSNETGRFSARVHKIKYDSRDAVRKNEETPYDIMWREVTDSSNWRPIAGGGGESILNIASTEQPYGLPHDPRNTVVRFYSTTEPSGFTRDLWFDGNPTLDIVLTIEVYGDPNLKRQCVYDYVLRVNRSRQIECFNRLGPASLLPT